MATRESDPAQSDPAAFTDDPLSAAIAEIVRETGTGGRLPSERDLAAQLGVSRTALRDRLQILESLGVLKRQTGSGTYVQELDSSGLAFALNVGLQASQLPLDALSSVRRALERQAAREATLRADPVLVAYMRKALTTIEIAPDDEAVDDADFQFHLALLRAAENPALSFFATALSGVLREAQRQGRAEMRRLLGDHEIMVDIHKRIYDGVISGDPLVAMAAVDYHFDTFDRVTGRTWPPQG